MKRGGNAPPVSDSPPPPYFAGIRGRSNPSTPIRGGQTRTVTSPSKFSLFARPSPSHSSHSSQTSSYRGRSSITTTTTTTTPVSSRYTRDGISRDPPPYNQPSTPPIVYRSSSLDKSNDIGRDSNTNDDSSSSPRRSPRTPRGSCGDGGQSSPRSILEERSGNQNRVDRFLSLLDAPNIEIASLRKVAWGGIPAGIRARAWKVLMGYVPLNKQRSEQTLARKRDEYHEFVPKFLPTTRARDDYEEGIYKQISIDIPRTNPTIPLFQKNIIHEMMQRILYIWAVRHPATSYVQGINDLCVPFVVVFLNEHVDDVYNSDPSSLPPETLRNIEADCYWCLARLIDGIQDRYTFAQPGIQRDVYRLKELIHRVDTPLYNHLENMGVDFLQFAFRWMNCLLSRELSLDLVIRMWDTYASEDEGFSNFHLYVCAAFLVRWSGELKKREFQDIMLFLQKPPTENWGGREIDEILAQGYTYQALFMRSPNHLK